MGEFQGSTDRCGVGAGLGNHHLATIMKKTEMDTESRENSDEEQVFLWSLCVSPLTASSFAWEKQQ